MKLSVEQSREILRDAGLRATPSRVAVLQLLGDASRPLSHADVVEELAGSAWNRSTLWRNLTDFEEAHLVRRTELGDRVWRFELSVGASSADEAPHAHPHFICTHCGTVECLPDEALQLDVRLGALPRSVQQHRVEVQIRGLCDGCES